ncbi:MAG: CPBP family intramembrane metalloprotease [Candidatus Rokubacteria bacterium]|nr:CPBP family intramembrane metalloprotease [Candidatus Rokubacteria bacterium]
MVASGDASEVPPPSPGDTPDTGLTPSGSEPPGAAPPARGVPAPAAREVPAPEPSLWYLAAAGALYTGLLLAIGTLADTSLFERAEEDPWTFLWVQVLDDGILTGVALLFGCFRFPRSWEVLGFRPIRPRWWAIGAGAGVAAAGLAWALSVGLEHWGAPVPAHPLEHVLARAESLPELALVLLAVTVPVPIGEEVFFRGYAYRLLRARFGVVLGIGGSALIFALAHGKQTGAWLPVFPVGIVLGLVVERSGSLLPAVVGHAIVNALAVLAG